MIYKLVVDKQSRNNPSSEKKEYEFDIEELRVSRGIYDSLVITKDEDYVMRRLELTENHVLNELDPPIKEPLDSLNIELFEGDNYIYLSDISGNKIYAEYLVKNDFTELYITLEEMSSAINQSANEIESSVSQKLTGYVTNVQMNSTVKQTADTITSNVSKTYSTKDELNVAKSEFKQTTDSISSTVSKKVGKDEVISSINQSPEEVKIKANKITLTSNDVLNLLAGNTINITSKNIAFTSDNFSLSKDGTMDCKNGNINTNKNITVGNNLYVGQNQESSGDLIKYIYFNEDTYLRRWRFSSGKNYLLIHSNFNTRIECEKTGYIDVMSDLIQMSHNPSVSSDVRLKKNIKDIDVSWINDLNIKEYEYKNNKSNKKQIGLIAQEYIGKEYSKYFLNKDSNEYYSISYSNITNALIKYCQELNNEIKTIKKELKEIKGE